MAKISIRELYKVFGSPSSKAMLLAKQGKSREEIFKKTGCTVALRNISLDIEEHELLVIMGLSGSGKSTLVRCLNRLIKSTKGSILVDGDDIMKFSPAKLRKLRQHAFGMVFQHFALFPHRTVVENAEYGLELKGIPPAERREKALEALGRVGLGDWVGVYPDQLSGGMQQRVGLARALALDPDILLMDEAFSALDPLIRRDMQDELLALQSELHKTIVFITHDLDEALKIGDRIVLLRDGEIVQVGTPEEILRNPADDYVARFVSSADITQVMTAGTVMKKSETVAVLGHDGPRSALRKMRMHSIASLFVVDKNYHFQGIMNADGAERLLLEGSDDIAGAVQSDLVTVSPETPASEVIPIMAGLPYPLAVVDKANRLKGVIVRGLLLGSMSERGVE